MSMRSVSWGWKNVSEEKVGQSSLNAIPQITIKANPFNGVIFENKNYEVAPSYPCQGHLTLYLVVVPVSPF